MSESEPASVAAGLAARPLLHRRRFASLAAIYLLLATSACTDRGGALEVEFSVLDSRPVSSPSTSTVEDPKNLLLVSLDTLRADHVSAYGYSRRTSPSLDRLAAEGVLFEHAYSHSPHTAQAHMTLFTSLYPSEHGVRNFQDGEPRRLGARLPTLAEFLLAAGYRTHAVVSAGNMSGQLGFDRGFGRYEERSAAAPRVFAAAIEALRGLAGSEHSEPAPFFLFVHTYEIHDPYVSPLEYRREFTDPSYAGSVIGSPEELVRRSEGKGYRRQHRVYWDAVDEESPEDVQQVIGLYDAGIRVADDHLGLLMQELETLGLEEETAVVVLSDHGEEFWEHGGTLHEQLYEELLHVPLVLRLPGLPVAPGQRISTRVRLIDLLPTVLDYLELQIPTHVQGTSMIPILRGEDPDDRPVFAEYRKRGLVSLLTSSWKVVARPPHVGRRSLKVGAWALHVERTKNRSELFDLATDPAEQTSRAGREPSRLEAMLRSIEQATNSFEEARLGQSATPALLDEKTRRQLEALGYLDR